MAMIGLVIGIERQGKTTLVKEIASIREIKVVNLEAISSATIIQHIETEWRWLGPDDVMIYDGFFWPDYVVHDVLQDPSQKLTTQWDNVFRNTGCQVSFVYVQPRTLSRYMQRRNIPAEEYFAEAKRVNFLLARYEKFLKATELPFIRISSDDWLGLYDAIKTYDFITDVSNMRGLRDRW